MHYINGSESLSIPTWRKHEACYGNQERKTEVLHAELDLTKLKSFRVQRIKIRLLPPAFHDAPQETLYKWMLTIIPVVFSYC